MADYDYLIVGAGLFGATFAHLATQAGKKCLVIDRRNHIGGNTYCKDEDGINVHFYGAHIFHTNDKPIWDFVNSFTEFNRYTNSPLANYQGKLYNLPFNMNTFYQLWGVLTPEEAQNKIDEQIASLNIQEPQNLEEQALKLVGVDIYEKLIKGYTEKQWGRKATELPAFIIKRLPVRFTFDNNYFNDKYQGIPIGGYNESFFGWGREDSELAIRLMNAGIKKQFIKMGGICYHLYHKEASREMEEKNTQMMEDAIEYKTTWAEKGVSQYLPE